MGNCETNLMQAIALDEGIPHPYPMLQGNAIENTESNHHERLEQAAPADNANIPVVLSDNATNTNTIEVHKADERIPKLPKPLKRTSHIFFLMTKSSLTDQDEINGMSIKVPRRPRYIPTRGLSTSTYICDHPMCEGFRRLGFSWELCINLWPSKPTEMSSNSSSRHIRTLRNDEVDELKYLSREDIFFKTLSELCIAQKELRRQNQPTKPQRPTSLLRKLHLSDAFQFDLIQFEKFHARLGTDFNSVCVLSNMPTVYIYENAECLVNALAEQLFVRLSLPLQIVIPLDKTTGETKNYVFLEFVDPSTALLCSTAVHGLRWGEIPGKACSTVNGFLGEVRYEKIHSMLFAQAKLGQKNKDTSPAEVCQSKTLSIDEIQKISFAISTTKDTTNEEVYEEKLPYNSNNSDIQSAQLQAQIVKLEKDVEILLDQQHEYEQLKSCVVCLSNEKTIVCLPCSHLCFCQGCSALGVVRKCPMCRRVIKKKLHIYT